MIIGCNFNNVANQLNTSYISTSEIEEIDEALNDLK
jgi:hypothetical protein